MKKLLTLFAFAELFCLLPMTLRAQHTVVNVVEQTATVTRSSTLYVGEVLLDGQQSFYYLYSEDMTNSDYIFGAMRYCLSDFKDGIYSALVPIIDGTTEEIGISFCSNSEYESMMNPDWKQAEKAGLACLPNMTVTSSSSEDLYETDADFAEKCPGEFKDITLLDDVGESVAVSGIIAQLSAVNTDRVTYTVENGVLVKHIERHINYTCEMTTVIYTRVELTSSSTSSVLGDVNGDGDISINDVTMIVNHILGMTDSNFIIANADINSDGEIDINDVMGAVSIILEGNGGGGNGSGIGDTSQAYLTCPDDNHPHMIDLGLPSGTKWACCNIGADQPKQFGTPYAWGETYEKDVFNFHTYQHAYCTDNQDSGPCDFWESEYVCWYYIYIGENICNTQYDVAHVKWGGKWRMPTLEQVEELINYWKRDRDNLWGSFDEWLDEESSGVRFYFENGGVLVLPDKHLWTGTLNHYQPNYAWQFASQRDGFRLITYGQRGRVEGYSVRPVWVP